MDSVIAILVIAIVNVLQCHGGYLENALLRILRRSLDEDEEPRGYVYEGIGYEENSIEHDMNTRRLGNQEDSDEYLSRRFYEFHPGDKTTIIGAPSSPNQLPEAEAILPGHTLIRPALGMLKSAVKFPHKDLDDGAGVYGNINNLGITYGGTGERVLYTGFRRSNNYAPISRPRYLIAIVRTKKGEKPMEEKPTLRYYKDYHQLELERQREREAERPQRLNDVVYTDNVVKVKQHRQMGYNQNQQNQLPHDTSDFILKYQTFVPSGLLIQFLESPSKKERAAQEEKAKYHHGKTYTYNYDGNQPYMGEDEIRSKAQDEKPKQVYNNNNNHYRSTQDILSTVTPSRGKKYRISHIYPGLQQENNNQIEPTQKPRKGYRQYHYRTHRGVKDYNKRKQRDRRHKKYKML